MTCAKVDVRGGNKRQSERKGKSLKVFPGHRCSVLCSASSRGSKEAKTLKMRYELSRICRAAFRSVSAHSADGRHYSCRRLAYCRRTGCRAEVRAVLLGEKKTAQQEKKKLYPVAHGLILFACDLFVLFSLLTPDTQNSWSVRQALTSRRP